MGLKLRFDSFFLRNFLIDIYNRSSKFDVVYLYVYQEIELKYKK